MKNLSSTFYCNFHLNIINIKIGKILDQILNPFSILLSHTLACEFLHMIRITGFGSLYGHSWIPEVLGFFFQSLALYAHRMCMHTEPCFHQKQACGTCTQRALKNCMKTTDCSFLVTESCHCLLDVCRPKQTITLFSSDLEVAAALHSILLYSKSIKGESKICNKSK